MLRPIGRDVSEKCIYMYGLQLGVRDWNHSQDKDLRYILMMADPRRTRRGRRKKKYFRQRRRDYRWGQEYYCACLGSHRRHLETPRPAKGRLSCPCTSWKIH